MNLSLEHRTIKPSPPDGGRGLGEGGRAKRCATAHNCTSPSPNPLPHERGRGLFGERL
jgi:hypothetical protein